MGLIHTFYCAMVKRMILLVSILFICILPFGNCMVCEHDTCHHVDCGNRNPETCKSGELVWGMCHCCKDTCAKAEGESCGGAWGFAGTCATGLECIKDNIQPTLNKKWDGDAGICRRKNTCQSIRDQTIQNEDKLQLLISKASAVMEELGKLKAENPSCLVCSSPSAIP